MLLRQGHEVQKHRHRQRSAEICRELTLALVDELIDQVIGELSNRTFQIRNRPGRQHRIEDVAVLAMIRRIDLERNEIEIVRRIARKRRSAGRGEDFRMSQYEERVFIFGDHPGGLRLLTRTEEDARVRFMQTRHEFVRRREKFRSFGEANRMHQLWRYVSGYVRLVEVEAAPMFLLLGLAGRLRAGVDRALISRRRPMRDQNCVSGRRTTRPFSSSRQGDLTAEAAADSLLIRRELQHLCFCFRGRSDPIDPGFVDVAMAGRAGEPAAALADNAFDPVVDGALHDGIAVRHRYFVRRAIVFDVSHSRHESLVSIYVRTVFSPIPFCRSKNVKEVSETFCALGDMGLAREHPLERTLFSQGVPMTVTAKSARPAASVQLDAPARWEQRSTNRVLESGRDQILERSRRIVDAAYELLEKDGLEALTIRAVLKKTGLSRRAFYERFADKDDLVLAVFEQTIRVATRHYSEQVAALPDPMERLKLIITCIVLGKSTLERRTANKIAVAAPR